MSDKPKFKWSYVLLCAVVGAVLGVLSSLWFGFIGTPWQAALTLSLIGLVVGLIQPALNDIARRSMGPKE
jgi:uncharacterized membrane-anchored protein YhcB (DUF1043 family)